MTRKQPQTFFRMTIHRLKDGKLISSNLYDLHSLAWRAAVFHMRQVGSLPKSAIAHIPKDADEVDSGPYRYAVNSFRR